MDVLTRIKRTVLRGRVRYTDKALDEMDRDDLASTDVVESILTAQFISKTLRSRSPARGSPDEKLFVIRSFTFTGTLIYTKGTLRRQGGVETFYVLVSAKLATHD